MGERQHFQQSPQRQEEAGALGCGHEWNRASSCPLGGHGEWEPKGQRTRLDRHCAEGFVLVTASMMNVQGALPQRAPHPMHQGGTLSPRPEGPVRARRDFTNAPSVTKQRPEASDRRTAAEREERKGVWGEK